MKGVCFAKDETVFIEPSSIVDITHDDEYNVSSILSASDIRRGEEWEMGDNVIYETLTLGYYWHENQLVVRG